MRYLLIIAVGFLFSLSSYAQVEVPRKSLPVERKTSPLPLPSQNKLPDAKSKNPFINRTQAPEDFPTEKESELDMNTDNGLLTAGDFIEKKWTEDNKVKGEYANGQNLGSFITKGSFVEIYCRDHQYVDGDRVRVYVNGEMVITDILLQANFTPVLVSLENGLNTIEFEALNQGSSGPNTAAFKLIDDKGAVLKSSEWNLLTGTRASMVVYKQ